jgi:glycosyltransferase involved in cell wall biosynthesis
MRLLHIMDMPTLAASGMPIAVATLASQQVVEGHDVKILLFRSQKASFKASNDYVTSFPCHVDIATGIAEFWTQLRQYGDSIEAVYLHGLWGISSLSSLLLPQKSNLRLRLLLHGALDPAALQFGKWKKRLFWHALQKLALSRIDDIIVTSIHEANGAKKMLPNRVFVLEPLVLPEIQPRPLPETGTKKILYFGRLHPIKGLTQLLYAWALVQNQLEGWELHLTGPDDAQWGVFYRQLAEKLSLERVSFNQAVPASARFEALAAAHLIVAPSLTENFGLTIAEALALGRSVIATPATGWQPRHGLFLVDKTRDLSETILQAARHVTAS